MTILIVVLLMILSLLFGIWLEANHDLNWRVSEGFDRLRTWLTAPL